MILRHYTGSAGAAGKAHIKSLFEKHVDIVYDDLSVHAADLRHTVIPGDFHPFDRHRMFRFVYTGFNLNQSQPGAASAIAGRDNAVDTAADTFLGSQIFEGFFRFWGYADHRAPVARLSFFLYLLDAAAAKSIQFFLG